MTYEAFEDKIYAPDWRVEATDEAGEGDIFVTLFSGPDARFRAEEYAAWKNSQSEPHTHSAVLAHSLTA